MADKIHLFFYFLFTVIMGLTGCATTTQVFPKVTEEKPTADKALIIVEATVGGLISHEVYDNGKLAGNIGEGGKLAWLRDPGKMELWSYLTEGTTYQLRNITLEAGKTYHYTINWNYDYWGGTGTTLDGPGELKNMISLRDQFNRDIWRFGNLNGKK